MESQDQQSNVMQIYEPVHLAIKAVIELHKMQTNPEYIALEKKEIKEIREELDHLYLQLEMSKP